MELTKVVQSGYLWPLSGDVVWDVYCNFLDLVESEDEYVLSFLNNLINLSSLDRLKYRNELANQGFELRPDELDQYIVLIIIALKEHEKVANG